MNAFAKTFFLIPLMISGLYSCNSKSHNNSGASVNLPDYKKGESFLGTNSDSAFYYFNKVAGASKDSLEIATSFNNMAAIQADAGDYFGSQESLLTSLQYLSEQKESDYYCLSSDYNELGNSSLNLKNYDAAIEYYDKAVRFSLDEDFKKVFVNNKAVCYQYKKDYSKAAALCNSIIEQTRNNKKLYARVLSNLARTRWLQDSNYDAAPELFTALHIRQAEKDDWGLNASYAHLSDYFTSSRPDTALKYAAMMYAIVKKLQSPDDELEALKRMITLDTPEKAKEYFARYQFLHDSLQTVRSAAKNQFALIRYDAEKNKADNLRLQKDNSDKKLQLYGIMAVLILGTAAGIYLYRKRKQQLIWQSERAIRESRLKTSQKVHDVVANGLYGLMSEMENGEAGEKEKWIDTVEILYEKSRDISYEQTEEDWKNYEMILAGMLKSFAGPATKVLMVGNSEALWENIKMNIKKEVEQVLRELMVNMKKHSGAENVVLRFKRIQNEITIQYTDDGKGLPAEFTYGNGLINTGNRIQAIGGRIIFDKETTNKGVKIHIHFPIT